MTAELILTVDEHCGGDKTTRCKVCKRRYAEYGQVLRICFDCLKAEAVE